MIVESDIKKLLDSLALQEVAQVSFGGTDILIRVFDDSTKLALTTPIYVGGNFIPLSVREGLKSKPPFDKVPFETTLHVDEDGFQISLNFVGSLDFHGGHHFVSLLEDFSWLAGEWRHYLDGHDKRDLVHVRHKP